VNPACFLATHGVYERGEMPPCEGRLIRAHLLPRQLLKKTFPEGTATVRGQLVTVDDLIASHGTWVLACGGPQGNGGHHGAFDQARTIRLPRAAVPPLVEGLALELGLDWWLDREYGPR
jgi:hypothetical protein